MSTGTAARGHVRGTVTRIAARIVLILLATAAAFWTTWVRLVHDTWTGSSIGFVFVLPVLAVFSAIGLTLRRGAELPIHDRQTDLIVGLIGLGLSACTLGLLTPRYRYLYEMLHLDLLAAWLFVLSACVLLFGLRPVTRYWPCWLLLLAAFPPPYRAMRVIIGGGSVPAGATMLLFAAFAAAIAVGRTRTRAWVGAGLAFAVGCVVLVALRIWWPTARVLVYQAIPSVVAVLV
ncbi:archaeosortase/exosortase family protein, partial [Nocardia sp. NPDC057030]|uniref:archaeosortase/exosortase family protein n=2 Tax=unclassified Nocardia TaxID=2637762 RepID=UPI00362B918E